MKHYCYFGKDLREIGQYFHQSEFWDILRTNQHSLSGNFYLPRDRTVWQEKSLNDKILNWRAEAIVELLKTEYHRIYSYGVGCAFLEYLLKKKNPSFSLRCFDFTPRSVEHLKELFIEADAVAFFNMLKDQWSHLGDDGICLLYRIDTEFDDQEWFGIFKNMGKAGVENILFIPAQFLTLKKIILQKMKQVIFPFLGKKLTFCGYNRTQEKFISLFEDFYKIEKVAAIGDLRGFLLKTK